MDEKNINSKAQAELKKEIQEMIHVFCKGVNWDITQNDINEVLIDILHENTNGSLKLILKS